MTTIAQWALRGALIVVAPSVCAQAAEPQSSTLRRQQILSTCSYTSQIAEGIMRSRQEGVAMYSEMEEMEKQTSGEDSLSAVLEGIIVDAYKVSQYDSKLARERSINKFRNDIYIECLRDAVR